jgi:hypothetical protein
MYLVPSMVRVNMDSPITGWMDRKLFDDTMCSAVVCQIECFVRSHGLFQGIEGLSKTLVNLGVPDVIRTGLKFRTVTASVNFLVALL